MKTGTVTIVIPLYNGERWIEQTLASAIAQSYRDLEILVVDDGSSDNSASIVERFCQKDSRVRLIRKENGGASSARNRGLEEAQGEYFAPLDQDDLWHPDKLRQQVLAFQNAGPDAGAVYCWCSAIDANGCILRRDAGVSDAEGNVLIDLIMANWMPSGSVPLFRTTAVRCAGGYRSSVNPADDIDLYIRIAEASTFRVVKEFLVGYRQHETNVSHDGARMVGQFERVMKEAQKRYPRMPTQLFRWSIANVRFHYGQMALRSKDLRLACWLLLTALAYDPALAERIPAILITKIERCLFPSARRDTRGLRGRRFLDLPPSEGSLAAPLPKRWTIRKAGLQRHWFSSEARAL